jgi:hypothetical protein
MWLYFRSSYTPPVLAGAAWLSLGGLCVGSFTFCVAAGGFASEDTDEPMAADDASTDAETAG